MEKRMDNPWMQIDLDDYEGHMQLDSVMQLQAMNELMCDQFARYAVTSAMVLGVAGGNGLNHVDSGQLSRVYGVDINADYLAQCVKRYPALKEVFQPIEADLQDVKAALPHAELILANLLIEYIGYEVFQRILKKCEPTYCSCVIQIDSDTSFVSDSPYLHAFDHLEEIHRQLNELELTKSMQASGFSLICREEKPLPNGKKLLRLDYKNEDLRR